MTFIVKTAATLRLADGSSFELRPGMHDDFPDAVKKHWAFASYAELVDTSKQDAADQKGTVADKKQIKQLQEDLKQVQGELMHGLDILADREMTIAGQKSEIDTLQTRVTELEGLVAETDQLRARIAELEKSAAGTDDGQEIQNDKPEEGNKGAKKQQTPDS